MVGVLVDAAEPVWLHMDFTSRLNHSPFLKMLTEKVEYVCVVAAIWRLI